MQRVVVVVGLEHAGHGAEDLFAGNAVLRLRQEQRWAHVVPGRGALQQLAAPHMLSALGPGDVEVALVVRKLIAVHHGTHFGAALQRVAHLECR
jgi:hypothetical protein